MKRLELVNVTMEQMMALHDSIIAEAYEDAGDKRYGYHQPNYQLYKELEKIDSLQATVAKFEEDGQEYIVGFSVCFVSPHHDWMQCKVCTVSHIYLDRRFRDGVTFRQLVDHMEDWAKSKEAARMEWAFPNAARGKNLPLEWKPSGVIYEKEF